MLIQYVLGQEAKCADTLKGGQRTDSIPSGLERDGSDCSLPSPHSPPTVPPNYAQLANSLPQFSEGQPGASASGPTIVLHRPEIGLLTESLAENPVGPSVLDTAKPRSQHIDEWSSMGEPSSDTSSSVSSSTRSDSPATGSVIPETVQYTIHTTFETERLPVAVTGSIRLIDASDYQGLEKSAEDYVRTHCEPILAGKSLYFRNGDCAIIGDNKDRHVHGLSSQEDWKDICTFLINFYTSNRYHHQHVDITRDYFALLTRRISDESFADSKRREIWRLMEVAFDGRRYIPRTDLTRVTSADMIQQIIVEDPVPASEHEEQKLFLHEVLQRGRKLLAMCVHAQLRMKCLRELLNSGHNDDTLPSKPLEDGDCCHPRCGPNFANLVSSQGGFNAAEFLKPGEHQELHRTTVLPIHYRPNQTLRDALIDEVETGSEVEEIRRLGEEATTPKQRASRGSGAFSKVYRVRLDPAHHKLTKVSSKLSTDAVV